MFCFSRARVSMNLKKVLSSKLDKVTLFTHSFVGWNLEHLYKQAVSFFFFRLNWHLKREKSVFWKASFCKTRTDYACKTSCTSFTTGKNFCLNQYHKKEFLSFFSVKLFYKSNRKLFSCVCIAWYKHSRGWENSRHLCKPETKSRICITVSNSPNSCRIYIGLCKHWKRSLLLKSQWKPMITEWHY